MTVRSKWGLCSRQNLVLLLLLLLLQLQVNKRDIHWTGIDFRSFVVITFATALLVKGSRKTAIFHPPKLRRSLPDPPSSVNFSSASHRDSHESTLSPSPTTTLNLETLAADVCFDFLRPETCADTIASAGIVHPGFLSPILA